MAQTHSDLYELCELLEAEEQEDEQGTTDLVEELARLEKGLEVLEVESLLDDEHDEHAAIVTIHAGAGGVDSCDWAEMLYRMYAMWASKEKLKLQVTDERRAEEAGVHYVAFRLEGRHAYGYLKAERGVHRLVRLSPFDANHRRHTSFASVDVIPELPSDFDIELNEEDIRMDVYRSSSAGGQHVNKTSSAVRLTHVPTGIVVSCQNERSQYFNRAVAMLQLKSKLVALMEQEHKERIEDLRGIQADIAWGSQIRNYILHPYQLVKDTRTGYENSNVQRVLDGDVAPFINAGLRWLREQRSQSEADPN